MMYLVIVKPKLQFRQLRDSRIKIVEAASKCDALKISGFITEGRHSDYVAPEAFKITTGQEYNC